MSISIYRVFRPFRHLNQRFGMLMDPEEVFHALSIPRILARHQDEFFRQPRFAAIEEPIEDGSSITNDKEKFQANLDVQHFKPEQISIKLTGDRTITIEGKQEDNHAEKGQIYRHFVNRFVLPKECDLNKIESKMSSDGVLTITAPKVGDEQIEYRSIPIMQAEEPAKLQDDTSSPEKKE